MRSVLVMVGVGVALLCVTTGVLLGVQGRLNHAGTKNIPVLRVLFAPATDAAPKSTGSRPEPAPGPAAETKARVEKREPVLPVLSGQPQAHGFEVGQLFDLRHLEATGLTVHDVNAMVARARQDREAVAGERADLMRERRELSLREADVEARYRKLAGLMQEITQARRSLQRDIETFNERVTELHIDEVEALRATARSIARLQPAAGAELVMEFWNAPDGQQKVVKLLAVMEQDRADEIVGSLDPKIARRVLERRMTLIRTGSAPGKPRRGPR